MVSVLAESTGAVGLGVVGAGVVGDAAVDFEETWRSTEAAEGTERFDDVEDDLEFAALWAELFTGGAGITSGSISDEPVEAEVVTAEDFEVGEAFGADAGDADPPGCGFATTLETAAPVAGLGVDESPVAAGAPEAALGVAIAAGLASCELFEGTFEKGAAFATGILTAAGCAGAGFLKKESSAPN